MSVSKTIFSGDWQLFESRGHVHLQYNGDSPIFIYNSRRVALLPYAALEVWQVLNEWVEGNAPNVEEEE